MANILDVFTGKKNLRDIATEKVLQIDPNVDPSKGGLINQMLANVLKGRSKQPDLISPLASSTPRPTIVPTQKPQPVEVDPYRGLKQVKPPSGISDIVLRSSKETGLSPSLLAAILWNESGYDPKAINDEDRGIAQINRGAFPNISDEMAYNPEFAIPWMARTIKSYIDKTGDINTAIAAYNVGIGRAPNKGPIGRAYVSRVSKNLSPDFASELGIQW